MRGLAICSISTKYKVEIIWIYLFNKDAMTFEKQPLVIDHTDWPKFLLNPPLLTSFRSGWNGINLAHYRQPSIELPEASNPQHLIVIPLGDQAAAVEVGVEGRKQTVSYQKKDYAHGCVIVCPADLPYTLRSHTTVQGMECIHCYLEPTMLVQSVYESVDPNHVELLLTLKKADLLIQQIGLALKTSLEEDGVGDRFYADAMATALSAHLLRYYSTRQHQFRDYENGLSQQKLNQAIDYIQAHLGEDLSLSDLANELEMSQYYFCRLFKRSTGISPHQYLIQQRVERAKHLLKQKKRTIVSIAVECGFSNQSHFAKYFRQCTGMNPNQFRKTVL